MLSLISIHIPKTAGTNFTKVLEHIYGITNIHLDYGTERDLVAARTCDPEILADPDSFRRNCSVVHGHFHYIKYKSVFPDVPVLATLRHPVARVVSQYRHIAMHGDPSNARHKMIMDGQLGLLQFAKIAHIANAQALFLEGIDIEDLDHAIIQEHFQHTVNGFCTRIGIDPTQPAIEDLVTRMINSRDQSAWDTKAQPIDPDMFHEIEKLCGRDLALYDRAVKRFVDEG